jgi:hypothetical protein
VPINEVEKEHAIGFQSTVDKPMEVVAMTLLDTLVHVPSNETDAKSGDQKGQVVEKVCRGC